MQLEHFDTHQMTCEEEKSPHILQVHGISLKQKKQGHRREDSGLCLKDFNVIQIVGEGTFGQEFLAKLAIGGHRSREVVFDVKLVQKKFEFKVENKILIRALVYAEPVLEGPANIQHTVKCAILDHDESDVTNKSASDKPMLEGADQTPQTAKCATADTGACGKMKLATATAVVAVSFVLIGNILYKY